MAMAGPGGLWAISLLTFYVSRPWPWPWPCRGSGDGCGSCCGRGTWLVLRCWLWLMFGLWLKACKAVAVAQGM
eukprot:1974007-Prymnesium_polylepis.1